MSALNCSSSSSTSSSAQQQHAAGGGGHDDDAEFACVQRADALAIRKILNSATLAFGPVNDNVTQRATPFIEARRAGSVAKVPLLAGSNGQEGMNLAQQYGITNFSLVTEAALQQVLYVITGNATVVGEVGPLINEIQAASPWFHLFEAAAQMYTEVVYQCVSITSAKNHSRLVMRKLCHY